VTDATGLQRVVDLGLATIEGPPLLHVDSAQAAVLTDAVLKDSHTGIGGAELKGFLVITLAGNFNQVIPGGQNGALSLLTGLAAPTGLVPVLLRGSSEAEEGGSKCK
jgi:hypothetical protein